MVMNMDREPHKYPWELTGPEVQNGCTASEVHLGIEKVAHRLSVNNNAAAALKMALAANRSLESRRLGFKLGFRDRV
jgi:hypothetical protein